MRCTTILAGLVLASCDGEAVTSPPTAEAVSIAEGAADDVASLRAELAELRERVADLESQGDQVDSGTPGTGGPWLVGMVEGCEGATVLDLPPPPAVAGVSIWTGRDVDEAGSLWSQSEPVILWDGSGSVEGGLHVECPPEGSRVVVLAW